jgi:hypothetical protein
VFAELDSFDELSVKVVVDGKQRRVQAKLRDVSCASCDPPTTAGISGWGHDKVRCGKHNRDWHESNLVEGN